MITHLAIISHGEIKFMGSKEELNKLYQYSRVKVGINNALQYIDKIPSIYNPKLINENTMECAVGSKEEVIALNTLLVSQQAEIFELKSNTGLEDWFIELTKTKPMKNCGLQYK